MRPLLPPTGQYLGYLNYKLVNLLLLIYERATRELCGSGGLAAGSDTVTV